MIYSPADPVLLSFGPFTIYYYGLIITSALALGFVLSEFLLKKRDIEKAVYDKVLFLMVLLAIICARLYHVFILNSDYYLRYPEEIIRIWEGGIAIHGAIIGGFLAVWLSSRVWKFSFLSFLDAVVPALLLGQAIGRWGNFFNQEAYGVLTSVPWAIYIEATGKGHHPTFLYESILNLIGVFILYFVFIRSQKIGMVFAAYLGVYGVNRMLIEPLRADSSYLFGYKIAFIVAVISVILSALLIIHLRKK